jgi:hypothetical protein
LPVYSCYSLLASSNPALCRGFAGSREVGLALFQERLEGLLGVVGPHLHTELFASSTIAARDKYMADVIAFRLAGRLSWTRKTLPARSVMISSIVEVLAVLAAMNAIRCGAGAEPRLPYCR